MYLISLASHIIFQCLKILTRYVLISTICVNSQEFKFMRYLKTKERNINVSQNFSFKVNEIDEKDDLFNLKEYDICDTG